MTKDLRIVFMGTPEFAVPSLDILVTNGWNIVGVITAPDKPQGRGKKLGVSAVKAYAEDKGLNILQPTNLKAPEFIAELKALDANLQIVVAFRMLPEIVWQMPALGTFNLHGSLLPKYRGAAPINWAIINGEKETGVTTFFLKHEIDTGDILFQEKESISDEDNVGTVYERLMNKGAALVLKTVEAIAEGNYKEQPQEIFEDTPTAPKIFRETCEINFEQPTEQVVDFIRGLSPYPTAWTTLMGKTVKVYKARKVEQKGEKEMMSDSKTYLYLKTADGYISIEELQMEGKKRMDIEEFLRGNRI
ncbi:methionyl-tRNA formyltransferase [Imperialibacter roseus]|uniref:Methionyl-tRNA formyltransferase n=1 Tax=Imperialibacter roseus TaxID=1324217 RepID=A0ABZ0IVS3_9BACT|nr:methionyl-tRNA formyltransferase [Imperialibacter roseus]WOK08035.1 methionyl-tRNA formyltransferase [Imperialibacter roseus]|tara:strand:- start:726 stop:1637 length:912 start_codon:yes stop_codon:yes gene_type:complete